MQRGILPLLAIILAVCSASAEISSSFDTDRYETQFVIEFIRHGARSHYEDNVPKEFFNTEKKGYVTAKGKAEHFRIGLQRREEYVDKKQFLSPNYQPLEILSFATFVQRCSTSGQYFLRGLYPLEDVQFNGDFDYTDFKFTPLKGTPYAATIKRIAEASNQCFKGPVIEIPHTQDNMYHTRNCKTLHNYLNQDLYDMAELERMLIEMAGEETYQKSKATLEQHFQKEINTLRHYFTLTDAMVAELYQLDNPSVSTYQRQECFILANNFVGEDDIHGKMYLSRMLNAVPRLFDNVIVLKRDIEVLDLKYLILNLHDTNISNILRFLGYFDENGYEKFVRFSSSVRFELLRDKKGVQMSYSPYKVRVVFDNEEIPIPGCTGQEFCSFQQFAKYFDQNLEQNQQNIDDYCQGGMGDAYTNELKYKK